MNGNAAACIDNTASPIVTERLVASIWDRQGPFALPLRTTDGEEIRVVYRGRRSWGRGPDFSGALIACSDESLCRGDVEIHVRTSDWRAHGHHRDPHYNGVILQVVLWDDDVRPARREDGGVVPVLALAPYIAVPIEELLDRSCLPWEYAPHPSPCLSGSREGDETLSKLLDRCGLERFEAKVARFESDLTCRPREQLLYQSVAEALGYTQNRRPFSRLAELVPLGLAKAFVRHWDVKTRGRGEMDGEGETGRRGDRERRLDVAVEALLLGAAGLLPTQRGMVVEDGYAGLLYDVWCREGREWIGGSMRPQEWEFFRVRPANFPIRRVAALAKVVRRWPHEGMAETLAAMVSTLQPALVPRAMESLLIDNNHEGYWNSHCEFGLSFKRPSGLIGRQRAADLVVNVFLPFLVGWASLHGDSGLAARAREVYRLYPKRGDNELTRYMAVQIVGVTRPKVARSFCRQQGLLQLFRAYCEAKSCDTCPVAAYPLPYYRKMPDCPAVT